MRAQFIPTAVFAVDHLYTDCDAFFAGRWPCLDHQVALAVLCRSGRDLGPNGWHWLVPLHTRLVDGEPIGRPAFRGADRVVLDRDHHGIEELEVLVAVEADLLDDRGAGALVVQDRKTIGRGRTGRVRDAFLEPVRRRRRAVMKGCLPAQRRCHRTLLPGQAAGSRRRLIS